MISIGSAITEACSAASIPARNQRIAAVVQPHRIGREAHQAEQRPSRRYG